MFRAFRKSPEKKIGVENSTVHPDKSVALMNSENCDVLLKNPNRGFRMETYITLGKPLQSYPLDNEDPFDRAERMIDKYRNDCTTLCQVYVYLSNYNDKMLDSLAFEQLERFFMLFRNHNIRMLLRFTYGTESVEDAPYKIVRCHIEQLKKWFWEKEALINDTLYCLQTGIVGYWGEGHSYKNLKKRDIKKVIADVADLAPQGIYTQVRTYKMLKLVSDENIKKVGIHDDYIIGDLYHKWSFIPKNKSAKFSEAMNHAKFTVNDGEMPWAREITEGNISEPKGKDVLKQLWEYSLTSFSLEHNYCENGGKHSIALWKEEYLSFNDVKRLGIPVNPQLFKDGEGNDIRISVYDILRYHLGYQLVLSNYNINGGTVSFSVTNYGFAAPLNFNYFALVCRDNSSEELFEIQIKDYDKTALQSGKGIIYHVNIPENCDSVGVKLETFKGRRICVRFANSTEFKDGVQYFGE